MNRVPVYYIAGYLQTTVGFKRGWQARLFRWLLDHKSTTHNSTGRY